MHILNLAIMRIMKFLGFSLKSVATINSSFKVHVHIPGASGVLATMKSSSELTSRLEEVEIVTAHKVLGQIDDGRHQTLL